MRESARTLRPLALRESRARSAAIAPLSGRGGDLLGRLPLRRRLRARSSRCAGVWGGGVDQPCPGQAAQPSPMAAPGRRCRCDPRRARGRACRRTQDS
eukprot:4394871-Pyramimonas_sp.AAC.1